MVPDVFTCVLEKTLNRTAHILSFVVWCTVGENMNSVTMIVTFAVSTVKVLLIYPLVVLMSGDVHHLIYKVSQAVLQSLQVVFGPLSIVINRMLSHLHVQM